MKQTTFIDKYPILTTEIGKNECIYKTTDEIIEYFKDKIQQDKTAAYIGDFDHYKHTTSLEGGEVSSEILDAKMVVFCFGPKLPNPQMLAIRPRSIGVCERQDDFVISFLEAPVPAINQKMIDWIKALVK